MVIFLICWGVLSVLGTLIAVTMIRAGKKQERELHEHARLEAESGKNEKMEDQHRHTPMGMIEPRLANENENETAKADIF